MKPAYCGDARGSKHSTTQTPQPFVPRDKRRNRFGRLGGKPKKCHVEPVLRKYLDLRVLPSRTGSPGFVWWLMGKERDRDHRKSFISDTCRTIADPLHSGTNGPTSLQRADEGTDIELRGGASCRYQSGLVRLSSNLVRIVIRVSKVRLPDTTARPDGVDDARK